MNRIFTLLLCFMAGASYAQNIGVGTNRPLSKLHVAGDLRIDSLAVGKVNGLVFHNENGVLRSLKFTGKKEDVLRGDGTFSAATLAADAAWLTTGNAGTNAAVNFIGTTDAQPLMFRVGNIWAGQLKLSHAIVAFGANTLKSNTTGANNIAIGSLAMEKNTSGGGNIGIGDQALRSNLTGFANVGVGSGSLFANTSGELNTGVGVNAVGNNTTGRHNTAFGANALVTNKTGSFNVAVGSEALLLSTVSDLVAVGYQAMLSTTTGRGNTAVGFRTLFQNTTGAENIAIGHSALFSSTRSSRNVAVGFESMFSNTLGASNISVGSRTLYTNTTGHSNVAVGDSALYSNRGAILNTAVGELAMKNNTGGNSNTSLGGFSLMSNLTGSFNTAVGFNADVTSGFFTNATAIGYNAKVNASHKVRIGNASVTKIEGQVPFTVPSDGRYKFNVREDVQGLAFIMKLRPVTYQFDVNRWDNINDGTRLSSAMRLSYVKAMELRRTGFIAQEVEAAADESGFDFSGVNKPESADGHYSLSYESFVVPLVKSIQEQQKIITGQQLMLKKVMNDNESLQVQVANQQQQINMLLEKMKKIEEKNN